MRTSSVALYRRRFPQTGPAVGEARRAVVDVARACGFRGRCLQDIETAAGEALANALEHGRAAGSEHGAIDIEIRRDGSAFTIDVKDTGRGFDTGAVRRGTCPEPDALRGFGTFIMQQLMDEVVYLERGTRLRLTKRIPAYTDERPAQLA